jgi:hypothetical protein
MAAAKRVRRVKASVLWCALLGAGVAVSAAAAPASAQTIGLTPIEQLHQALHLTPQQESAWQLYRSAADAPDKAQSRRRSASSLFRTLDAPHRMDLVEAEMRQELADLQHQSQVLKAFYAALSPEQRRVFDERTLPPADQPQGQGEY